jgi:glycosyltransferase involved in cell wall biosynthesis
MAQPPEIALLVSSFQRPGHLRRALTSIALQEGAAGKMELVVTDDGSEDCTPQLVKDFGRSVSFPVRFTTHRHEAFQLARCRNEGVRASTAPYLLFLDGDCVLPRDHVAIHLRRRRPGVAMAGDCMRLDATTSALVTEESVRGGPLRPVVTAKEWWRVKRQLLKNWWYVMVRHPTKPKLLGGTLGMWRSDFERVNGYDENFVGWGCEDDDLGMRLRRAGVKIRSILFWTHTYHLWHPVEPTYPRKWREGVNVPYLLRPSRPVRCENGLRKAA